MIAQRMPGPNVRALSASSTEQTPRMIRSMISRATAVWSRLAINPGTSLCRTTGSLPKMV